MISIRFIYSSEFADCIDFSNRLIQDLGDTFSQILVDSDFDFEITDLNGLSSNHNYSDNIVILLLSKELSQGSVCVDNINQIIEGNNNSLVFQFSIDEFSYSIFHPKIIRSFPIKLRDKNLNYFLSEKEYWEKIVDLGYDISQSFKKDENQKKVYLAEVSPRYESLRGQLRRELLKKGVNVYPKESSDNISHEEITVDDDLDKCELSIHVLGRGDFNQSEDSIADLINLKSSEYCLTSPKSVKRIIWLAEEDKDLLEEESLYIESIKRNARVLRDAEVLQVPTEKLKSLINDRLFLKSEVIFSDVKKNSVYLIHEQEDSEGVIYLADLLIKKGFQVFHLNYNQSQLKVFSQHRFLLSAVGSVFIFHSHKNHKWVSAKLNELLKAPGYGREREFDLKGIYMKDSTIIEKVSTSFDTLEQFSFGESFKEVDFIQSLERVTGK